MGQQPVQNFATFSAPKADGSVVINGQRNRDHSPTVERISVHQESAAQARTAEPTTVTLSAAEYQHLQDAATTAQSLARPVAGAAESQIVDTQAPRTASLDREAWAERSINDATKELHDLEGPPPVQGFDPAIKGGAEKLEDPQALARLLIPHLSQASQEQLAKLSQMVAKMQAADIENLASRVRIVQWGGLLMPIMPLLAGGPKIDQARQAKALLRELTANIANELPAFLAHSRAKGVLQSLVDSETSGKQPVTNFRAFQTVLAGLAAAQGLSEASQALLYLLLPRSIGNRIGLTLAEAARKVLSTMNSMNEHGSYKRMSQVIVSSSLDNPRIERVVAEFPDSILDRVKGLWGRLFGADHPVTQQVEALGTRAKELIQTTVGTAGEQWKGVQEQVDRFQKQVVEEALSKTAQALAPKAQGVLEAAAPVVTQVANALPGIVQSAQNGLTKLPEFLQSTLRPQSLSADHYRDDPRLLN
jgi:hypothetical protein